MFESISSTAAVEKKRELRTKAFVDSFDKSWRKKIEIVQPPLEIGRFTNVLRGKVKISHKPNLLIIELFCWCATAPPSYHRSTRLEKMSGKQQPY